MAVQDRETPRVFMKPPSTTVIGPGERILIPPVARSIDWEGELAVVMGRKAKAVKAEDALKYVAGYTIMNDVSERDLVIKERTDSRERDKWFDWLNGKWLDTFGAPGAMDRDVGRDQGPPVAGDQHLRERRKKTEQQYGTDVIPCRYDHRVYLGDNHPRAG